MNLEIVTLENNQEYYIVKQLKNYLYLVNTKNKKDICIRKAVMLDDKEYIDTLDTEEEFKEALALFRED